MTANSMNISLIGRCQSASEQGLQHVLEQFAAARDEVGMKLNTTKTGVLYLFRNLTSPHCKQHYTAAGGEILAPWYGIFTCDGR